MFGLGYQEFLIILIILVVLGLPSALLGARVARRAGFSRAWALLLMVPPLHFVMIWIFAFVPWPTLDPRATSRTS